MTHDDAGDVPPEACGRCSMTSITGMTRADGESSGSDPFGDARIEVDDDEMRKVSAHVIALGRVKQKLNDLATRLTYGR